MTDDEIETRIDELEREERTLRAQEADAGAHGRDDDLARERDRLAKIKVELDQWWDLLRQRRALRRAGEDPDRATMRDAGTVERYLN